MNRFLFSCVEVVAALVLSYSCIQEPKTIPVTGVTWDCTSLEMMVGESTTIMATVSPRDASNPNVVVSSSNGSVARVSSIISVDKELSFSESRWTISALSPGEAVISVITDEGRKTATCSVTVKEKPIPVKGISLSYASSKLVKGEKLQLSAEVYPQNATNKRISWSSDKPEIAQVDENGLVSGISAGVVHIIAVTEDGGFKASCEITVIIRASGITLSESSFALDLGLDHTITATIEPADASDKHIIWDSSNPSIATVEDYDNTGTIMARSVGTAIISARPVSDPSLKAECTVTVLQPITGLTVDPVSLKLNKGETATLSATIHPANASYKTLIWSSDNSSVATVDDGIVKAVGAGSTVITVQDESGTNSAKCDVTVVVPVASVTLDHSSLSLKKGETAILVATVSPVDATDRTVVWSSSNPSVITVNNLGLVTAVAGGTATVSVTAGDKTASCTVTVTVPVSGVSLNESSLSLNINSSEMLKATVSPSDASNKNLIWSSVDPGVAIVDGGKVTAVGAGSTTITVRSEDGDKTAQCEVTVVIPVVSVTLNQTTLSLRKGESTALIATVSPTNATDKTVTWSSSNTSVVTVNGEGLVTAVAGGSATVSAKAGDKTASCAVTVSVPVTGVSVSPQTLVLEQNTQQRITATVSPSDASNKQVTWKSSNPSVATVSDGMVHALNPGTSEISVTTVDGEYSATCSLTVEPEKTKAMSLSFASPSLYVGYGSSYSLPVKVLPEDAICQYSWKSSNSSNVSVSGNAKSATITSKSASTGYTTVTVTDQRTGLSASIKVYSFIQNFAWKESTGETYSGYPLITIARGGTHQLKYSCDAGSNVLNLFGNLNDFAFYEPSSVVSSPKNITLSPDGLVTGVKTGTTGIKPTGYIQASGARVYVKVVDSLYESEYNDDQGYANTVPYGIPMAFDLRNASDVDWFKLLTDSSTSGNVSVTISLEFSGASSLSENENRLCKYSLYDSSMQLWGAGSFTFSKSTPVSSTTRTVPNGPLYLKVYFDTSSYSGLCPVGTMTLRMTVN